MARPLLWFQNHYDSIFSSQIIEIEEKTFKKKKKVANIKGKILHVFWFQKIALYFLCLKIKNKKGYEILFDEGNWKV